MSSDTTRKKKEKPKITRSTIRVCGQMIPKTREEADGFAQGLVANSKKIIEQWNRYTRIADEERATIIEAYLIRLKETGLKAVAAADIGISPVALDHWAIDMEGMGDQIMAAQRNGLLALSEQILGMLYRRMQGIVDGGLLLGLDDTPEGRKSYIKDGTLVSLLRALRPDWRESYDQTAGGRLLRLTDLTPDQLRVLMADTADMIAQYRAQGRLSDSPPTPGAVIEVARAGIRPAGADSEAGRYPSTPRDRAGRPPLPRNRSDLKRYQ